MIPYAMLYTVVAGVPFLVGALALGAILRRYGRSERAVWLAALVLAFAVPALSLLEPFRGEPAVPPPTNASVIGLPEVVALPVPRSSLDLGQLVVALWIGVSVTMAVRWMVATLRLSWSSRSWRPETVGGVPVLITDDVGPAVSGVLRPRILAPEWLTSLPARERELILMHEEEHVRARDPMLVAAARAARVLTPWNPVVWALTAKLVRAVELDCDRRVLKRSADVAAYGHTLLKMSARRPGRFVAAAAFAESEAPLRSRILAITTPSRTLSLAAIAAATVLGVVLLLGAMGIPVPTVRLDVQVGDTGAPTPERTPTVTAFDTPPTPPPPPPPAVDIPREPPAPQLVVLRGPDGEMVGYRFEGPSDIPEPEFTPMTVRPTLTNSDEVSRALTRAYPALLREAGIGGAPVLWLHIDETGIVDATRVHESSGYDALDEAAMRVAEAMRFTPAFDGDAVTATWVQIPIRFAVVAN